LRDPMALPTSGYLKTLIAAIDGEPNVPRAIRNECHRLMQAIDGNNAAAIADSVARIEALAAEASFELPARSTRD